MTKLVNFTTWCSFMAYQGRHKDDLTHCFAWWPMKINNHAVTLTIPGNFNYELIPCDAFC